VGGMVVGRMVVGELLHCLVVGMVVAGCYFHKATPRQKVG
jgi:hypothetical protein